MVLCIYMICVCILYIYISSIHSPSIFYGDGDRCLVSNVDLSCMVGFFCYFETVEELVVEKKEHTA